MSTYQLGSKGPEVSQIEGALKTKGLYLGPIDGIFGGGLQSAVRKFQQQAGLSVDGVVGPQTWAALMSSDGPPPPAVASEPLATRCLALTGSFETGAPIPDCFAGLSGNFDGQGISFGVLQWNFGQGSLQPLLKEMDEKHSEVVDSVFGTNASVLRAALSESEAGQMAWIRSIQTANVIEEPWRGQFKALGRTSEFVGIETEHAAGLFSRAGSFCDEYSLSSERAAALMFDILTQNGSISAAVKAQILADYATLPSSLAGDDLEVARMKIVAERRSRAANPKWVQDVLSRKMTIALGTGTVHGEHYDLEAQYGIGLSHR